MRHTDIMKCTKDDVVLQAFEFIEKGKDRSSVAQPGHQKLVLNTTKSEV